MNIHLLKGSKKLTASGPSKQASASAATSHPSDGTAAPRYSSPTYATVPDSSKAQTPPTNRPQTASGSALYSRSPSLQTGASHPKRPCSYEPPTSYIKEYI